MKVLDSPCHRLRTTLETIWNDLPQKPVARAEQNFQATASMHGQGWRTLWTFNVIDFMLMCLQTCFPSSFIENFDVLQVENLSCKICHSSWWKCYHILYTLKLIAKNDQCVYRCIRVEYIRVTYSSKIWHADSCRPSEPLTYIQGGPKKLHTILLSISLLNIDRFS